MDLRELAEMLEETAAEITESDPVMCEKFEDAAYEIRLRLNDVGALLAYWDDERFADRKERDFRPEV